MSRDELIDFFLLFRPFGLGYRLDYLIVVQAQGLYVIRTANSYQENPYYAALLEKLRHQYAGISFCDDEVPRSLQNVLEMDRQNLYLTFDEIERVTVIHRTRSNTSLEALLDVVGLIILRTRSGQNIRLRLIGEDSTTAITGLLERYGLSVVYKDRRWFSSSRIGNRSEIIRYWLLLFCAAIIMLPAIAEVRLFLKGLVSNQAGDWVTPTFYCLCCIVALMLFVGLPIWLRIRYKRSAAKLEERLDTVLHTNAEEKTCEY